MLSYRNYHKGAMFIEYALILAFIVVCGLFFVKSDVFSDSIGSIFGDASTTVGIASGNKKEQNPIFPNFIDSCDTRDMTITKTINGKKVPQWISSPLQGVMYNTDLFTNLNDQYKEMSMEDVLTVGKKFEALMPDRMPIPDNAACFSDGKATSSGNPNVYIAWTDGTPKEGESVKVMMAKIDGSYTIKNGVTTYTNNNIDYYVVDSTYTGGSFTRNIVDSGKLEEIKNSSGMTSNEALKIYYK